MKHKFKQLLSLMLVLSMLMSVLSVGAAASDTSAATEEVVALENVSGEETQEESGEDEVLVDDLNGDADSSVPEEETITVPATSLVSVTSNSSKKLKVKWKKGSDCDGYQLQYATSSSFSSAKTAKATGQKTTSKSITGLKKGKTYYVRIRAYKQDGSKVIYSKWSASKKVELPKAVLLFASDYQKERVSGAAKPAKTLKSILKAVYQADYQLDNVLFCGDYTYIKGKYNYNASPNNAIAKIKSIFSQKDSSLNTKKMIFVQGNHDKMTSKITANGLHDCGDYLVYVMNTESMNPWCQGLKQKKSTVQKAAKTMKACFNKLIKQGETRPIFIATHVPLHYSGRTGTGVKNTKTGDNLYSSYLFKVINQKAKKLNLVYLFGHNHSGSWDSYLGGGSIFRVKGDTILIPKFGKKKWTNSYTKETLNFTYMNAGYVGYISSKADNTFTCGLCRIYGNRMVFTRYDAKGVHVLGAKGVSADKLVPKKYNVKKRKSEKKVAC